MVIGKRHPEAFEEMLPEVGGQGGQYATKRKKAGKRVEGRGCAEPRIQRTSPLWRSPQGGFLIVALGFCVKIHEAANIYPRLEMSWVNIVVLHSR